MINTTVKIKDIIIEDVDVSFWRKRDELFNPVAHTYAKEQESRTRKLRKSVAGTPVFTKPAENQQELFTNEPKEDQPKSLGYIGNVDARLKAGVIDQAEAKRLLDIE